VCEPKWTPHSARGGSNFEEDPGEYRTWGYYNSVFGRMLAVWSRYQMRAWCQWHLQLSVGVSHLSAALLTRFLTSLTAHSRQGQECHRRRHHHHQLSLNCLQIRRRPNTGMSKSVPLTYLCRHTVAYRCCWRWCVSFSSSSKCHRRQWLKWGGQLGGSAPCSDLSPSAIVWAPWLNL